MAFTSKDVMELRQRTGVGMMDCKKALVETDGDMEKAIDYLRAQKRFLPITERSAHSPSAEEDLFLREREKQLYARIQDLAPQYAEVLQLHYFEEFSVKEMCKILHKSTKQVYNLLSRAKLTLKENFCKEGISHEDL